jgi:hypothetical protein
MTFKEELEAQRKESQQQASGSSSKTPWSSESWKPGAAAGVSVPKNWDQIYSDTSTLQGIAGVSDPRSYTWRESRQPSDVPNYYALSFNERDLFNAAAKSIHPLKTGEAFYGELIKASYDLSLTGIFKSPQELAYDAYEGSSGGGGGAGGGSRAYAGPTATTTLASERDLRSTADAVASTVIGRGITDEEFQKVLKQVRVAERAEPTVTTPGGGSSVTQSGLSAQGRQDIIRDALMKGPEAKDYSKATKMMDVFYKALESRPEGA